MISQYTNILTLITAQFSSHNVEPVKEKLDLVTTAGRCVRKSGT